MGTLHSAQAMGREERALAEAVAKAIKAGVDVIPFVEAEVRLHATSE